MQTWRRSTRETKLRHDINSHASRSIVFEVPYWMCNFTQRVRIRIVIKFSTKAELVNLSDTASRAIYLRDTIIDMGLALVY